MAWSGGNFTRANPTWVSDAANGIGIEAGRHDTQDNDFTTGIDQCLNKTGQNGMTGALSMGSNKITNLAAGTLRNDAAQVGQVQDGDFLWLGTTAGTAAAQTASATPAITAYKTGQVFRFISGFYTAAEAAVTLNVNGIGAKTCVGLGSNTPLNGFLYLQKGIIYEATYNGTNFAVSNVTDLGQYSADAGGARVRFYKSRGVDASTNTIVQSGDSLGQLDFFGANGTNYTRGAIILAAVDGIPGASNDMPTRLTFNTSPDGSGSPAERMRITSAGNVGIGLTPAATNRFSVQGTTADSTATCLALQNSTPASVFYIRNDGFINSGTLAGSPYNNTLGLGANMYVGSDGTFYRSVSSIKYKTDVEDYDKGLAELLTLRPVYYKDKTNPSAQYAGLIAEEVLEAGMPEFIQYAADNTPDGLSYGHMMSLAVNSIKELNAKVEALEARIAALEA
jgi:hypothetical protein